MKIIRYIIRGLCAVVLALPMAVSGTAAALCLSDCSSDTATLFGQTQAYDVLLRGNGQAVVTARISITNHDTSTEKSLKYTIASGSLTSVTAFQEIQCSYLPTASGSGSAASTDSSIAAFPGCYPSYSEKTLTGQSANTGSPAASSPPIRYYAPTGSIYKKIAAVATPGSFTLNLPQEVKPSQNTTVIVLYDLNGVSTKSWGAFHYTFKTLQSALPASDVTVAVSSDENYILAGADSNVNYSSPTSGAALGAELGVNSTTSGVALDDINNIGGYGQLIKHASSLSPEETFTVSGSFAAHAYLLHLKSILFWILGILIVLAALAWWYLRRRRHLEKVREWNETQPAESSADGPTIKPENARPEPAVRSAGMRLPSVSVQALPFYGFFAWLIGAYRRRTVRPLFFAWNCSILFVLVLALLAAGIAVIGDAGYYSDSSILSTAGQTGAVILAVGAGVLAFIILCLILPYLYAGNLRRTVRVLVHIFIFFLVVSAVFGFLSYHAARSLDPLDSCSDSGINIEC